MMGFVLNTGLREGTERGDRERGHGCGLTWKNLLTLHKPPEPKNEAFRNTKPLRASTETCIDLYLNLKMSIINITASRTYYYIILNVMSPLVSLAVGRARM